LQAFLAGLPGTPGPVAAVTHGGITTDLLCNLLGDDALPPHLLDAGIPPCAVTAMDDLNVIMIASTTHLSLPPPERQSWSAGATRPQRQMRTFPGHDGLNKIWRPGSLSSSCPGIDGVRPRSRRSVQVEGHANSVGTNPDA
jgi:hypothetical protein